MVVVALHRDCEGKLEDKKLINANFCDLNVIKVLTLTVAQNSIFVVLQ